MSDFPELPLRVILVEPRNPLNIGAVARAMSNFGFADLRLVQPYEVAFREARSAVRSGYILERARTFETLAEAIADCSLVVGTTAAANRDLHIPLYRLEAAGQMLRETLSHATVALLFGSEKFGLSNDQLSYCHWSLRIPARNEHGSMNLGQAAAICLYEARRDVRGEGQNFPPPPVLPMPEIERATTVLFDILQRSGYIQGRTAVSSQQKLRRLIRRLRIPAVDGETWLGILRQILWKVRGSDAE